MLALLALAATYKIYPTGNLTDCVLINEGLTDVQLNFVTYSNLPPANANSLNQLSSLLNLENQHCASYTSKIFRVPDCQDVRADVKVEAKIAYEQGEVLEFIKDEKILIFNNE